MKYTNEQLARAAHTGEPPPNDPFERAQYYMMQRLYRLYERGRLPKEDAVRLKGLVLDYESLDKPARRMLLDSFIESWGIEDLQGYRTEIKEISKLYLKEIDNHG